jgi:pantetheine hydrolase
MWWLMFLLLRPVAPEPATFLAAVYEHELVVPWACTERVCSREEAVQAMQVNLAVLRDQVAEAARQGAAIILLPEDGIHGYGFSRETLRPFLESVPSVADGSNPCLDDQDHDTFLLQELSCLAAEHGIYLAAHLATRTPGCGHCGPAHGEECYFNTLVVLDSLGRLAALYHKYNLWTSELNTFDIDPAGPQLVTLETPFGRLGLAVCADLMWRSPVVDLAEQEGVDTLLLPLSWWDLFPHQLAHSTEAAWARGLQVNLLAANTHEAAGWSSGSGIYGPDGPVAYYHDLSPGSGGRLLLARLATHPAKAAVDWPAHATEQQDQYPEGQGQFQAEVYGDNYTFVPIQGIEGRTKVCQGDFCCLADWQVVVAYKP